MEAQFKQLADIHNKLQKNYDELEKTHSTLIQKETHALYVSMASKSANSHSSLTFDNSDLPNIVIQAKTADGSEVTFSQSTTDS
eukprot:13733103-Ditylum_brightwellii.AAC.1